MPRTITKVVKSHAEQLQHILKEFLGQQMQIRTYNPKRDGMPIDALDPRSNRTLFFLRHAKEKHRPPRNSFGHNYSYSVTFENIRLRITAYGISRKEEKKLARLLARIAAGYDIVIYFDVIEIDVAGAELHHWNKHIITPQGIRQPSKGG